MMNPITQYCRTLATASKPLPQVVRRPALLKLWLFEPLRGRLVMIAVLLAFLVIASPVSKAIVDRWYPLEQDSLKTNLMELVNSPKLRKLQSLRETRYRQLLGFFWISGLSVTLIILLLDLPRALREAERLSARLMRQSSEAGSPDPVLSEALVRTAQTLRLDRTGSKPGLDAGESASEPEGVNIESTEEVTRTVETSRHVGPSRRYRIGKALARGGAGIVYEAEDTVLGRKVALKELLEDVARDEQQAERFKSEARALALLNHTHIMPVYDLLEEDGRFWLVMELLTGGTLRSKIEAGTLDKARIIEIITGIASGLELAHRQGFVHRDIKPANILFADDGSFRITDFGIAKHRSTGIKTSYGLILGSPAYMSPEQAAGEPLDSRSDIYSLGVTMFHMLVGELPFQGDTSSVMAQHITRPASPPSSVDASISEDLDAVVIRMLAKKPDDRFQTMSELIEALKVIET